MTATRFVLSSLVVSMLSSGIAQEIELTTVTFNGEPICELTLDEFTGTLGRPSAVEAPHPLLTDLFGPELHYHHLGITMMFRPGDTGEEQLFSMGIHLSRTWDPDSSEWFQIYEGGLSPRVDGNWRIDRTLTELAALGIREVTPEQQRVAWEEAGVLKPGEERVFDFLARLSGPNAETITFFHEPITRFMERVTIACERPVGGEDN